MSESTALLTPEGVAAYPSLFQAKLQKNAKPNDKPKFSTAILFTEDATKTPEWQAMVAAVYNCGVQAWGKQKFDAMMSEQSVRLPFRRDVVTKGYPATFFRFINIASGPDFPPAVVDRAGNPITDPRAIHSGTFIRASVSTRSYGGPGTEYAPGISLDMRNIQMLRPGPVLALGGASDPKADFGAPLPPLNDPPAAMPDAVAGTGGKSLAELMG